VDLTPQQLAALKASVNGDPALAALPRDSDGATEVARVYNLPAVPAFTVWRDLPMDTVQALHVAANMTPLGNPPTTPDLTVQVWIARCVTCQGKQLNYQGLTQGRSVAPMKRAGYRAAIQDCLTNVPAGTNGALLSAGWVEIRDAAKSPATTAEKLFATGTGTTAAPADLTAEGPLTYQNVLAAWELP
jgi:hypothetical protein